MHFTTSAALLGAVVWASGACLVPASELPQVNSTGGHGSRCSLLGCHRHPDGGPPHIRGGLAQALKQEASEEARKPEASEEGKVNEEAAVLAKYEHLSKEELRAIHRKFKLGFFAPRPILQVYYVVPAVLFAFVLCIWLVTKVIVYASSGFDPNAVRSEFLDFRRPDPEGEAIASSGWFSPQHCPPRPRTSMQVAYMPSRALAFKFWQVVPAAAMRQAVYVSAITGIVWCCLFIASKSKVLKREFVTFHGQGEWFLKGDNVWKLWLQGLGGIEVLLKMMLAFLLIYYVRLQIRWFEMLKTKVWLSQRRQEMVSFSCGSFLAGTDELRLRARHDIYRWLTTAQFLNFSCLSPALGRFRNQDLVQAGLLSSDEVSIMAKTLDKSTHNRLSGEVEIQAKVHAAQRQEEYCQASRMRDLLLWWVELQVQAAVKQGLMDKDKLKKIMGHIWQLRDSMQDVLLESSRRQMSLLCVIMQIFVDLYVVITPASALSSYTAHLWTLPGPMMRAFIVAFFYNTVLALHQSLWNPYDQTFVDALNLDPILVVTERTVFANLSRTEKGDLPNLLAEDWAAVKDLKEEKKKEKGDSD